MTNNLIPKQSLLYWEHLPKDRKNTAGFRKNIIKNGFSMMQYSRIKNYYPL
ncbi:MAG: hypothetical protein TRG1_2963 [Flavobacteriaceae bacterium FS1-H7996/R]|nr:MAG: hypothetical protein TRG1_2963 [Flavobacteriaceae bacterium FS1-H7996/R]